MGRSKLPQARNYFFSQPVAQEILIRVTAEVLKRGNQNRQPAMGRRPEQPIGIDGPTDYRRHEQKHHHRQRYSQLAYVTPLWTYRSNCRSRELPISFDFSL